MKSINIVMPPLAVLVVLAVLAMLGLQALVEYRLLAPLTTEAVRLAEDTKRLQTKTATEAVPRPRAKEQLDDILFRLEKQEAPGVRIEHLHQIANEHGVVIRKASYRSQALSGEIARHEMQADLGGTYPAIRQFLRTLLMTDEAAALESLEFSRPSGGSGVQAQVRIVLFYSQTKS
jgi:hypothetical protein